MHKHRHQVYATLQGKFLNKQLLEQLPEVSGVGRYKNADSPGIIYPERAQFHLLEPANDYSDVANYISRLEKHYPILRASGVHEIILRWTILSNSPGHEMNTELSPEDVARLAGINASVAITFYASAHYL
ncbi:MAG: hypothetical protein WA952_03750 [Lewinella sp.]